MSHNRHSIASALNQVGKDETGAPPLEELETLKRRENRKITMETLAAEAAELRRRHGELLERLGDEIQTMDAALTELKPLFQELQEERPENLRPQDTEQLRQFKRKLHTAHMELMKLEKHQKHHDRHAETLADQPAGRLLAVGFLLSLPLMLLIVAAVAFLAYQLQLLFG